jgi:hypothetical protein
MACEDKIVDYVTKYNVRLAAEAARAQAQADLPGLQAAEAVAVQRARAAYTLANDMTPIVQAKAAEDAAAVALLACLRS